MTTRDTTDPTPRWTTRREIADEVLTPAVERLAALYSGPHQDDPAELSEPLRGALADVAKRVNMTAERFLRHLLAWYFERLLDLEEQVKSGGVRVCGAMQWNDPLDRPLPLRTEPTFTIHDVADMPQPREDPVWVRRMEWARIERALDAGRALCLAFDPPELPRILDIVQTRLGRNLVVRVDISEFKLWVNRWES